jgi:hypothetical protein
MRWQVDVRRKRRHRPELRLRHEHLGRWTIYLTPWACGREGGLLLGPFQGAPAAMAAANEYVAVYLAGKGEPP